MTAAARWLAARARLATWILGAERVQRINTGASLLAATFYAVCAVLEACGVTGGGTSPPHMSELLAYMLVGPALFYGLLRTGGTRRLRQPSLMLPQALYAVGGLTLSYPAHGAVRGLNLMLLALLPVFGIGVLQPRGIRWLGALSLMSIGAMMGWMVLRHPERFDPKLELEHFVLAAAAIPAVAQVAAVVSGLRWKQRHQRKALQAALASLESLATRDELTGLFNRSHMQQRLAEEAQRGRRQHASMCVCLVDIDHFKRVNDQHGHAIGDRVLQRFARRGTAVLRDTDVLARWGGEEFLLLLPSTTPAAAERVLSRLRLAQRDDEHDERDAGDGPLPHVSFSAGVALHGPADDVQASIALADAALYRAKSAGRDRVVLATGCRSEGAVAKPAAHTVAR